MPFREVDLWNGYPEERNMPYSIAEIRKPELADCVTGHIQADLRLRDVTF